MMQHGTTAFSSLRYVLLLLTAVALPGVVEGAGPQVSFANLDLAAVARATEVGGSLALIDVPLDGSTQDTRAAATATVELKRVQVFTPDAKIVVHGKDGVELLPAPDNVYLRGTVRVKGAEAEDNSIRAYLTVRENGEIRGIFAGRGQYWMIGNGGNQEAGLMVRNVEAKSVVAAGAADYSFNCATDALATPEDLLLKHLDQLSAPIPARRKASYTAQVAVETDYEFYQLFGNTPDAIDYVADIISYASGVYDSEVDTSLYLPYVSLWTTSGDPWTETGSLCLLYQFGRYWNDNHGATTRTIAHYMSGKSTGGGVAWVGVLCRSDFMVDTTENSCGLSPAYDNYGGGYGFTGSLSGTFDINNPQVIWDIVAVTHEIGHNFSSGHTHCYGGIDGNASPVDECYAGQCGESGCFCGSASLPCAAGPGNGCGTIMSYCHLLSGGMSNITYTFGDGHPHGVAPERVPNRMNDHVVWSDSVYTGCLDFISDTLIFNEGFESGNTTDWTSTAQ